MDLISYKNSWELIEENFLTRYNIDTYEIDYFNLKKFLFSYVPKIVYVKNPLSTFSNFNFTYRTNLRIVFTSNVTAIVGRALADLDHGKGIVIFKHNLEELNNLTIDTLIDLVQNKKIIVPPGLQANYIAKFDTIGSTSPDWTNMTQEEKEAFVIEGDEFTEIEEAND